MSANQYIYIRRFNDQLKTVVQTNAKQLVLNKDEALLLQQNIFDVLAQLAQKQELETSQVAVQMDGGTF